MTATPPPPAVPRPAASVASVALTVAAIVILVLSASVAAVICGLWLLGGLHGDMMLLLFLAARSIAVVGLVLAGASFALIVWASRQGRRGVVAMAVASLLCQLPVLIAVAALSHHAS